MRSLLVLVLVLCLLLPLQGFAAWQTPASPCPMVGMMALADEVDGMAESLTVATIVAGLLPLFWGMGTGSEVMQRIAAPMIGGMISAPLLSLLVVPVVYRLMRRQR